jgi:hypothetical protein
VSRLRQRPTNRWAILALGGACARGARHGPGLGWQLSVAGTYCPWWRGGARPTRDPRTWRGARRRSPPARSSASSRDSYTRPPAPARSPGPNGGRLVGTG